MERLECVTFLARFRREGHGLIFRVTQVIPNVTDTLQVLVEKAGKIFVFYYRAIDKLIHGKMLHDVCACVLRVCAYIRVYV